MRCLVLFIIIMCHWHRHNDCLWIFFDEYLHPQRNAIHPKEWSLHRVFFFVEGLHCYHLNVHRVKKQSQIEFNYMSRNLNVKHVSRQASSWLVLNQKLMKCAKLSLRKTQSRLNVSVVIALTPDCIKFKNLLFILIIALKIL